MATPYTFDPEILNQIEPHPSRKRTEENIGIGFGRIEEFHGSRKRDSDWKVQRTNAQDQPIAVGNSFEFLPNGMEVHRLNSGGGVIATLQNPFTIKDPAKNINYSVTFSFALSMTHISTSNAHHSSIMLPGGLMLHWKYDNAGNLVSTPQYQYYDADLPGSHTIILANSSLNDVKWKNFQKVVVVYQDDKIKVWENDVLLFEATIPAHNDVVGRFGLQYYGNGGGNLTANMINFQALVGLTQPYIPRTRGNKEPSPEQRQMLKRLGEYAQDQDLHGKTSNIRSSLSNIQVGPSSIFWGVNIDNNLRSQVNTFQNSEVVRGIQNIVTSTGPVSQGGPTLFVGIEANASFLLSVGYSLGFLIALDGSNRSMAVLVTSAGFETNAGIEAGLGIGFFPNSTPVSLKGFGGYNRISFDTPIGVGIGANISGNLPWDTTHWSNCGPGLSVSVGVSLLPVSYGVGLSYTFEMFNLG